MTTNLNRRLTRRRLLTIGGGLAALGLTGCLNQSGGGGPASGGKVQMRISWWGSAETHKRQQAGVDAVVKAYPSLTFKSEYTDYDSYWNRLATQVSGGNAPDVFSMNRTYLHEYAGRNVLAPLDDYAEQMDLSQMDKNYVDLGRVDGKLYGIGRGMTIPAVLVDQDVLNQVKLKPPADTWSWDGFGKFAQQIRDAVGGNFYGSEDGSGKLSYLELFVRERGGSIYENNKISLQKQDLIEWFEYWAALRQSKACVPANIQAAYQGGVQNSPLVKGSAAIILINSDASINFTGLIDHRLVLLVAPSNGKRIQYFSAPSMLSIFARSEHKDEGAQTIGTLVTDLEVAKGYGLESGPPPSKKVQDYLRKSDLDVMERQMLDFSDLVTKKYTDPPPDLPPKGAGEIALLLTRIAEDIAFGKVAIPAGAEQFFAESERMLANA